jgi:adenine-specific DNA-methyltransferase
LSDLLRQVESKDPQLAADLKREFEALSKRRAFGLNFERHVPETVELPGRPIRRGDKVRFLPERGNSPGSVDRRLWRVKAIRRTGDGKMAELVRQDGPDSEPETAARAVDDLVVVAEFRDPIYPGLVSTGKVERGGDKPFHTVINAENFHALQALLYTHEGKVDAIYIDPPYNTGARDWKYNNDYVDSDDAYRHSKWLAMMERRLKLAKRLLNPNDSVLIVTIDEKEYLRLGLLLSQLFSDSAQEMVTTVISSKGVARVGQFSRVEEYIFLVRIGSAEVHLGERNMLDDSRSASADVGKAIQWLGLRRREPTARRGARPNQFFPIYIDESSGQIHSVGNAIDDDVDRNHITSPNGTFAVWPLRPNGEEGLWGLTPERVTEYLAEGFVRARNYKRDRKTVSIHYLPSGTVSGIRDGSIEVRGSDEDGAVRAVYRERKGVIPKRVWNVPSHNAETGGTLILSRLIPNRRFPFPKSLFAVEDVLRFFIDNKPEATVIDFFAGSGTTAQAVMRLNRQDAGHRQSISVTNNEISADDDKRFRQENLRPGDSEWEKLGICDYITKPRITAAVTGKTPDEEPIKGDYKFTDEFPMAEGFEENVEFFTMTYESPRPVAHHRSFEAISPLLWLKAGAQGRRIEKPTDDFDIADTYGILFDLDQSHDFIGAIGKADGVRMAFVVTDDDRAYQAVCAELPAHVEPVRLYESYLTSFTINTGKE